MVLGPSRAATGYPRLVKTESNVRPLVIAIPIVDQVQEGKRKGILFGVSGVSKLIPPSDLLVSDREFRKGDMVNIALEKMEARLASVRQRMADVEAVIAKERARGAKWNHPTFYIA